MSKAREQGVISSTPPRLFSTKREAAQTLRLSVKTVERLIASGELKAKRHGRAVVILNSEIERYVINMADWTRR